MSGDIQASIGAWKEQSYSYTYDEEGRLTGMQAGGRSLAYAYDALGRVTAETSSVLTKSYAYRTVNGRTCDLVSTLSYTKANGTSLLSLSYEYDAAGNITKVYKSGVVYNQYAYDELGQLIREDNKDANKSYTYTYDSRGNILEKKTYAFTLGTLGTAQSTASYGYATDSWKDRLTSYNGQTITYDAIGNPLTYNNGSAYTFTWEGRQMQTATKGNTTWTYTYNADGLRIGKTDGTTTTTYTWNENSQRSSMTWNTGSALFYYDADGIPYAVQNYDAILDVERTYLYITNLQGDVLSIIDASSGATAVTYTYDAWGRLVGKDGTSSDYASIYEYNPLTYRGYIYDSETGFYYLKSRYYDPTVGRFLNADDVQQLATPINVGSILLYAYCYNNPVIGYDNNGNSPIQAVFAAIGAIAGWFLGDYVARCLGYYPDKGSFWSKVTYWTIRTGVVIGGAVIGWFAASALTVIIKGFIFSSPNLIASTPMWVYKFLGIATGSGSVVLGKYPLYVSLANKLGSSIFQIADSVWKTMSESAQWAANKAFLDKIIESGQKITLQTNAYSNNVTGYFAKEIGTVNSFSQIRF